MGHWHDGLEDLLPKHRARAEVFGIAAEDGDGDVTGFCKDMKLSDRDLLDRIC